MGQKHHSRQNGAVLLLLITGLPGTGKSTMAEEAGRTLGAPVLGHDWAMSGLRPYAELQEALDRMGLRGHRAVSAGRCYGPWRALSSGWALRSCSTAWPEHRR
jgi:predicted kinase